MGTVEQVYNLSIHVICMIRNLTGVQSEKVKGHIKVKV